MTIERTFSIIKPDAVAKNIIGEIYHRFECAGLHIIAAKMLHLFIVSCLAALILRRLRRVLFVPIMQHRLLKMQCMVLTLLNQPPEKSSISLLMMRFALGHVESVADDLLTIRHKIDIQFCIWLGRLI